ncbi:MAG TPA: type VII secretion target [Pseudonocardiaceae bacterium]
MRDGFRVDPDRLRRSGADLAAAGDGLASGTVPAGGPQVWGSDAEGALFAAAYNDVADTARDAFASLAAEFASLGERLTATAATYAEADEQQAAALRRIDGVLPQ